MNLYMVPLRARHVRRIGPYLRDQDQAEALALDGRPAIQHLSEAVGIPGSFAIMNGSVPCGACGVTPAEYLGEGVGIAWAVGTPRLTSNQREFLRASREVLAEWHKQFPILSNGIHAENTKHIRWLHRLGARFVYEGESPTGAKFRSFLLCVNQ